MKLDLRALAASCSDRPVLVGFLQRRREPSLRSLPGGETLKRYPNGPKALTIAVVRTILQVSAGWRGRRACSAASLLFVYDLACAQEREPLADLGRVFDVLCAACANVANAVASPAAASQARADDSGARMKGLIPAGSPAVTADEMLDEVFAPMAEEAGIDSLYLRAALVEYLRAADTAGIPVPAALPVLLVRSHAHKTAQRKAAHACPAPSYALQAELLLRDNCAHQLPMWAPLLLPPAAVRVCNPNTACSHVSDAPRGVGARCVPQARAQPSAASAAQSLALAADAAGLEGVRQMAVDAQRRAHAHDTLVREMLLAGQVLQALRYVRRNRVESVPPAVFMEAAAAQDDPPIYASTYRFCSEYVPGFADLPDHAYYSHRLVGSS